MRSPRRPGKTAKYLEGVATMYRLSIALCVSLIIAPTVLSQDQAREKGIRTFTYKKAKQADLDINVHFPEGWKKDDKRPIIVFFFGGGWTGGSVKQFEPQAAYLATRGMVAAR